MIEFCWKGNGGTAPFVGVTWFGGTVWVGLWPVVVRLGRRPTALWELKRKYDSETPQGAGK